MLENFEVIAKEVCSKHGVGLYDIKIINTQHGKILCVYITRVNGVSITDCTKVSKELNAILDNNNIIEGSFTLEVSSPGIERPLKFKKHYATAINEWVSLKLDMKNEKNIAQKTTPLHSNSHDGDNSTIFGILKEVNQDYVTIENEGELNHISYGDIKKAKTIYKSINPQIADVTAKKENK
ncbi:MAG: ribosome maturation factor RimP [Candidatus Cloacimonetes bacterium]|nr:ribosome maturation factor RimP [Candidatus Cloacimonadota bacterium]